MRRLAIGFLNHPYTVREVIDYAVLAEKAGFESAWMADESFLRDIIPYLSGMALQTKTLKLATGIINPFTRSSIMIAQTIATLDELSHGRMILGLGAGGSIVEKVGISYDKPLTKVKESIKIIRDLIAGKEVTFNGITQSYSGAVLGRASSTWSLFGEFIPPRKNLPIYVAAMGPKMLQLAGELADGVLLSAGCPIGGLKFVVENLKRGSQKSKRNYRQVDIAAYVPACLDPTRGEKSVLRKLIADFITSPAGASYLPKSSTKKDVVRREGGLTLSGSDIRASEISDEILHQSAAFGTRNDCVSTIESYRKAGVNLPIIFPIGKKVKELISIFSASSTL